MWVGTLQVVRRRTHDPKMMMSLLLSRFLAATLAVTAIAPDSSSGRSEPSSSDRAQMYVVIRAEVQEPNGSILRAPTKVVSIGHPTSMMMSGTHAHQLDLIATPSDIVLSYTRDGNAVANRTTLKLSGQTFRYTKDGYKVTVLVTKTTARIHHPSR